MSAVVLFVLFFVILLFGLPISVTMGISSILPWVVDNTFAANLVMVLRQMMSGVNSLTLLAIPMFMLSGTIMARGGISKKLFDVFTYFVGNVIGGVPCAVIITCLFYGAISGSAPATVAAVGAMTIPVMVNLGYSKEFSTAVVTVAGGLGCIIPPSIPAVVYAMVANVSVGKLLFGGIVPGFFMGFVMMAYVFVWSKRHNGPKLEWQGWRYYLVHLLHAFISCLLPLLTPAILLGGIYLGVVTTTEAAAVAVLYSLILGVVIYKTMGFKDLTASLKSVFIASGSVLLIIPASKCFSFVLTAESLQDKLYQAFSSFAGDSKFLTALCVTVLFLILGCLSDPNVNIMVFVPMVIPLLNAAGFDPVHAGICIIVIAMIGNITPPVGVVLMTTCSLQHLNIERVSKALLPWIAVLMGEVVILWLCEPIVTFVPNLLMG